VKATKVHSGSVSLRVQGTESNLKYASGLLRSKGRRGSKRQGEFERLGKPAKVLRAKQEQRHQRPKVECQRDCSLKTEERTRERVRATASRVSLDVVAVSNAPSNPTNDASHASFRTMVPVPSARLGLIPPGREGSSIERLSSFLVTREFFDGEFDPGSGRTLAACLTHASRTRSNWWQHQGRPSGERVSNT
jgi:hypothetical protein